jgi:hypothetical protein
MHFYFTKHSKEKLILSRKAGFCLTQNQIKQAINSPLKVEHKPDGTQIVTVLLDKSHILRVVYRTEDDIIIIITFYPGRRGRYEI